MKTKESVWFTNLKNPDKGAEGVEYRAVYETLEAADLQRSPQRSAEILDKFVRHAGRLRAQLRREAGR